MSPRRNPSDSFANNAEPFTIKFSPAADSTRRK
jgi:hypothetical protein